MENQKKKKLKKIKIRDQEKSKKKNKIEKVGKKNNCCCPKTRN